MVSSSEKKQNGAHKTAKVAITLPPTLMKWRIPASTPLLFPVDRILPSNTRNTLDYDKGPSV